MNDPSMPLCSPAASVEPREPPAKKQRLSLACNECRKRKVKCDAEMPKCRNCQVRGIVCETTDPKHPSLVVIRKYGAPEGDFRENVFTPPPSVHVDPGHPASATPSSHDHGISWVARSYEAHQTLDSTPANQPNEAQAAFVPETSPLHHKQPQQHHVTLSHESPDHAINMDSTNRQQKLMGGSSLQSLSMFLDLYLQRAGLPGIGPCFRHGMGHVEEFTPLLVPILPDLPPTSLVDRYVDAYFRHIHPLYPVLDEAHFHEELRRIRSYQDASWSPSGGFAGPSSYLQAPDVPVLACIYGVLSLGSDEAAGQLTETGHDYLVAAYGLQAHLIGLPHLSSVQALILITLALQARAKEGQSFQTLGAAIRISHSIGLHRHLTTHRKPSGVLSSRRLELHARVWWTCYALERLYELQTSRPSSIPQGEHDPFQPNQFLSSESHSKLRHFLHWVSLAFILERISGLLYRRKRGPGSTLQLLESIGILDQALRDWKNSLPEDIRPTEDGYCSDQDQRFATFLALHYHQALITLHRASLILPQNQLIETIEEHASALPFHGRLRAGASLCEASACATIKLNVKMGGRLQTPLYTLTQLLHGCVVLGLSILRHPQSLTVRADLELLATGTRLAEAEYGRVGQDPRFIEACSILRTSLAAFVSQHEQAHRAAVTSWERHESVPDRPLDTRPEGENEEVNYDWASVFQGVAFEDLWTLGADAILGVSDTGSVNFN